MLCGPVAVGAIDLIREKAAKYPAASVNESPGWIAVKPTGESTFEVGLRQNPQGFTVFYEGWHEEIDEEEEALNLFARGLSSSARLEVVSHGGVDHRWTAEFWEDNAWQRGSITGLFLFPFWKTKSVRYLQNDLIREDPVQ